MELFGNLEGEAAYYFCSVQAAMKHVICCDPPSTNVWNVSAKEEREMVSALQQWLIHFDRKEDLVEIM